MVLPISVVPHHVAIVMDGNGRWATSRFMPRFVGHRQGVEALRHCVRRCAELGIKVVTVFAFSSENWSRPDDEVSYLMGLMVRALGQEIPEFQRAGIQVRFVGERASLSRQVRDCILDAEAATANSRNLLLNVCFNYGGRWDIVQAAAKLNAEGIEVTEQSFARALALSHVPDPDFVIRTGGETRISNFLLWQAAYAEFYFSDRLWPDFDAAALDDALLDYARRERRFGMTSQQVLPAAVAAG
jgi:undecaprenyl diphosphate synthase